MRDNGIDLLKMICCLLIVGLHACLFLDKDPYVSYMFMNGISRIAVPIFLIISGYYFYNIKDDKIRIMKWIKKLLIPYLIFSIIFIPFWKEKINVINLIHFLVFGYFQLWYIPALIVSLLIYVSLKQNMFMFILLAVVFFFLNLFFQYYLAYNPLSDLNFNEIKRNILFTYPYFIIGIIISKIDKYNFSIKNIYFSIFLLLVSLLYLFEVEHNFYFSGKPMDNLFFLPLLCICIFIIFKKIKISYNLSILNYYTTIIFFSHGIFILILHSYKLDTFYVFVLTLILSVLTCYFYSGLLFLYHYYKRILITKKET